MAHLDLSPKCRDFVLECSGVQSLDELNCTYHPRSRTFAWKVRDPSGNGHLRSGATWITHEPFHTELSTAVPPPPSPDGDGTATPRVR